VERQPGEGAVPAGWLAAWVGTDFWTPNRPAGETRGERIRNLPEPLFPSAAPPAEPYPDPPGGHVPVDREPAPGTSWPNPEGRFFALGPDPEERDLGGHSL